MLKKFLYFLLATSVFLAVSSAPSYAQSVLDVTVSPIYFDISTDPGQTITQKIRVRNNTTTTLPLNITVDTLKPTDDGTAEPVAATKNDDFVNWVKFEDTTPVALPREWTDIPFTIEVPGDAAFGYYLAIRIGQKGEKINESGAKLVGEVVVPILLDVKNKGAIRSAKLLNFSTGGFVNDFLPVNFKAEIENEGNVHVAPRGNVFIRSGGKDIDVLDINAGSGNILPNGKRTFETSWEDGFAVMEPVKDTDGNEVVGKDGKVQKHLVFNWDKLTHFRMGKYAAQLVMVYDNGTRDVTLDQTTTFWVIPWKVITVVVVCFAIVFGGIWLLIRGYIKGQIKKGAK